MYLNVLKFQNQIDSQTESINEFRAEVHHLKKYVSGNWAPSKTQQVNIPNGLFRIRSHSQVYLSQELLSQLLGHWLIKPLQSYDKIYVRVKVSFIVSSTAFLPTYRGRTSSMSTQSGSTSESMSWTRLHGP